MYESTIKKENAFSLSIANPIVKFIVLSLVLTAVYGVIVLTTASLSWGWGAPYGFRVANAMRGFGTVSPAVAVGISLGGIWSNIVVGRLTPFHMYMTPFAQLIGGLIAYRMRNIYGGWLGMVIWAVIGATAIFIMQYSIYTMAVQFPFWPTLIYTIAAHVAITLMGYTAYKGGKLLWNRNK